MAALRPWFRFYNEALNDRKMARIARTTGRERVIVLGVWAGLLCLASESPERGTLLLTESTPFDRQELADEIGCNESDFDAILDAMLALGMLTEADGVYSVTNWGDRQFESDSSRERVARYRGRMKRDGNVTVTAQETEQSIEETETESIGASAPQPQSEPEEAPEPVEAKEPAPPKTVAAKEYFAQFRRKRWATQAQREEFEAAEKEVGTTAMLKAVRWAATENIASVRRICTAARTFARNGPRDGGADPPTPPPKPEPEPRKRVVVDNPLLRQYEVFEADGTHRVIPYKQTGPAAT